MLLSPIPQEDLNLNLMGFSPLLHQLSYCGIIYYLHYITCKFCGKIREIVLAASKNGTPWLFPSASGTNVHYSVFIKEFKKFLQKYQIADHKLHDGRKTFVTNAKAFELNEYAIKRIVGHSITDITENIYTERPISWLAEELEKM